MAITHFDQEEQREIREIVGGTPIEEMPEVESFTDSDLVPFIKVTGDNASPVKSAAVIKATSIGGGSGGGEVTGVKGDSESSYRKGNVNITKANIGLGNVENKSASTLSSEIMTSENVKSVLGCQQGGTKYLKEDGSWDTPAGGGGVEQIQSDWNQTNTSAKDYIKNKPTSMPANGGNAATVNSHSVEKDVPSDAVFTDHTYSVMGASGSTHASGLVPDTPTTAGTSKFLREDGQWAEPQGGGGGGGDAPAPSTEIPPMDGGSGAVGSSTAYARADHKHPSDTSRVSTSTKVNGKPLTGDITLTASDVGALPSNTSIPDELSDLSDDSTHRLVTDTEKQTWNNKQDEIVFNTAYNASTNKAATMADIPSLIAADEEDITNANGYLKLKNRTAATGEKGMVILRKGTALSTQMTATNTVYIIRYAFDLNNSATPLSVPSGCVLFFDGGSISNGTVNLNGSIVERLGDGFLTNVVLTNVGNEKAYLSWFNLSSRDEITDIISGFAQSANVKEIHLHEGEYIQSKVTLSHSLKVYGHGCLIRPKAKTEHSFYGLYEYTTGNDTESFEFYDFKVIGDDQYSYRYTANRARDVSGYVFNFNNIQKVVLDGITIGKYWSNTDSTGYVELYTIILRCTDVTELVINNCEFYNCRSFEWLGFVPYNKKKADLKATFTNNYIHDVIQKSITLFICDKCYFAGNVIDKYYYNGSIFNLHCNYLECCFNTFTNTWNNAFDTCEYGWVYAQEGGRAESLTPQGEEVLYQQKVYIHDNVFKGIKPNDNVQSGFFLVNWAAHTVLENNVVENVPLLLVQDARATADEEVPSATLSGTRSLVISGNKFSIDKDVFVEQDWTYGMAAIFIYNVHNPYYSVDIHNNDFYSNDSTTTKLLNVVNCNRISITDNSINGFRGTVNGSNCVPIEIITFHDDNHNTGCSLVKSITVRQNKYSAGAYINYGVSLKNDKTSGGVYNPRNEAFVVERVNTDRAFFAPDTVNIVRELFSDSLNQYEQLCYIESNVKKSLRGVLSDRVYLRHNYLCHVINDYSMNHSTWQAGTYTIGTSFLVNNRNKVAILMSDYTLNSTDITAIDSGAADVGSYEVKKINDKWICYISYRYDAIFKYTISTSTVASRPNVFDVYDRVECFCTTDDKVIYWTGTKWIDASGTVVQ